MELLQLTHFRAVARLEHMTRAAEELNVTQPALSRSIARLERELGVPLFDRQGRGLRLTDYGAAFQKYVDRVFQELADASAELRDMSGLDRGSVSIAAGALHWLPPVLEPFLAAHPDVQFRLVRRSLPELIRLVEEGDVDFCFLPDVPLDSRGRWLHLRTAPIALMVPPSHRLARLATVALSDLVTEEIILGKPGDILREIMDGYFRQVEITPRISSEVDEPGAVEEFVAAGLGVSFIPELQQTPQPQSLTARIAITDPGCELTLGLAWNTDRYLSLAARAFREHVVAYFAENSPDAGTSTAPRNWPIDEPTAFSTDRSQVGALK